MMLNIFKGKLLKITQNFNDLMDSDPFGPFPTKIKLNLIMVKSLMSNWLIDVTCYNLYDEKEI